MAVELAVGALEVRAGAVAGLEVRGLGVGRLLEVRELGQPHPHPSGPPDNFRPGLRTRAHAGMAGSLLDGQGRAGGADGQGGSLDGPVGLPCRACPL